MSKAVKILLEGMTDWLRLCWFDLHTAQRKIYVAIQDQIGSDQLSANPFYLFYINPALLLAFFSLTAILIILLYLLYYHSSVQYIESSSSDNDEDLNKSTSIDSTEGGYSLTLQP